MAVKYRVVMSSEIARCPQHRLDPQHWIPRHKTEQCGRKAGVAEEAAAQGLKISCCGGPLEERRVPGSGDGYDPEPDGGFAWYGLYCPRCKMEYTVMGGPAEDAEDEEEGA